MEVSGQLHNAATLPTVPTHWIGKRYTLQKYFQYQKTLTLWHTYFVIYQVTGKTTKA